MAPNDDDLRQQAREIMEWAERRPSRLTAQTVFAGASARQARRRRAPAVVVAVLVVLATSALGIGRFGRVEQPDAVVQAADASTQRTANASASTTGRSPTLGMVSTRTTGPSTPRTTPAARPTPRAGTRTSGLKATGAPYSSMTVGDRISLRPANRPGSLVRHQNYLGRVDPITASSPPMDLADSTFVVREGLADGAGISLEASNFPGSFLEVVDGTVRLGQGDGSAGFAAAATFLPRPGLNGADVSFVLAGDPKRYLRHDDSALLAQPDDGTARFRDDASFVPMPALG